MENSEENICVDDDLFSTFPDGTRIFIQGNTVTFENMTPELLEIAQALNPDDERWNQRKKRPVKDSK